MNVYILTDKKSNEVMIFHKESDALKWMKYKPNKYEFSKHETISHVSALNFIEWDSIPNHFNFVYKDSTGVYACYYKPVKTKWFGNTYSIMKKYGGEKIKLDSKPFHNLFELGDYFERPYGTSHFINWNKIKGTHFIKYRNDVNKTIDIFDYDGSLLFSGSNNDVNIINESNTQRFCTFYDQLYTFVKNDYQTGVRNK